MVWFWEMVGKSLIGWMLLMAATFAFAVAIGVAGWELPKEYGVEFWIGAFFGVGFGKLWRWIG